MYDKICILPWIHFYIGPHADILPCCVSDSTLPISQVNSLNNSDNIINHYKFKLLRLNMLNNIIPKECNSCFKQEKNNIKSHRLKMNEQFKHHLNIVNNTHSDGGIENFHLIFYDIRTNKICNLKCRMCSGYFSSRLAAEEQVLWNNNTNIKKKIDDTEIIRINNMILADLPYIEKFYFAGGEPMMMPEHYTLLEQLIKLNIVDVPIRYNSNLSTLSYKNKSIISLWKKFTNIVVGVSIDALYERAEFQRHGTTWDNIASNLQTIQRELPQVKLKITSVLSIYNAMHLCDDQLELITKYNIEPNNMSFNVSFGPEYIDIRLLPNPLKNKFINNVEQHILQLKQFKSTQNLCNSWQNAVKYIKLPLESNREKLIKEFKMFNTDLDKHRNESFTDVFPELKELYD